LKLTQPWLVDELDSIGQHVQIGEFTDFGKGLVIDGRTQLAEADEIVYTSALVFPTALNAPSIDSWLIAGGGDGAAVREVLRFRRVENVTLVDVSQMVVEQTQKFIPVFWGNCQNDPRLRVRHQDVFAYMRETKEKYDVIVSDLTDPPEAESKSAIEKLTRKIRLFQKHLTPGTGLFVTQAGELSMINFKGHKLLRQILEELFVAVYSYRIFVEFFGWWQSFLVCSLDANFSPWRVIFEYHNVENALRAKYAGKMPFDYYSDAIHNSLFTLPPILESKLKQK